MPVAFVSAQSTNASGFSGSNAISPGTPIAIGSLVFATVGYQFGSATNNTIPIVADLDTFTVETAVNIGGNYFFTVGYFINTTASHSAVNITLPAGTVTNTDLSINTFSGVGAGTLHAKAAPAASTQGNPSGANKITTASFAASAGDLLVAFALDEASNGVVSLGTTLPWVLSQHTTLGLAEHILSSAGGTPAASWGNSSNLDIVWGVAAYSFTPAGGGVVMIPSARRTRTFYIPSLVRRG